MCLHRTGSLTCDLDQCDLAGCKVTMHSAAEKSDVFDVGNAATAGCK